MILINNAVASFGCHKSQSLLASLCQESLSSWVPAALVGGGAQGDCTCRTTGIVIGRTSLKTAEVICVFLRGAYTGCPEQTLLLQVGDLAYHQELPDPSWAPEPGGSGTSPEILPCAGSRCAGTDRSDCFPWISRGPARQSNSVWMQLLTIHCYL